MSQGLNYSQTESSCMYIYFKKSMFRYCNYCITFDLIGITSEAQDLSTVIRPLYLEDVSCYGNETSLLQCLHTSNNVRTCSDGAATIICQGIMSFCIFLHDINLL